MRQFEFEAKASNSINRFYFGFGNESFWS
uniref:uORF1 protein n=2 Tax=Zika virus TaxID=64320 RepID=ORF1_ZIKVF